MLKKLDCLIVKVIVSKLLENNLNLSSLLKRLLKLIICNLCLTFFWYLQYVFASSSLSLFSVDLLLWMRLPIIVLLFNTFINASITIFSTLVILYNTLIWLAIIFSLRLVIFSFVDLIHFFYFFTFFHTISWHWHFIGFSLWFPLFIAWQFVVSVQWEAVWH